MITQGILLDWLTQSTLKIRDMVTNEKGSSRSLIFTVDL